MIIKADFSVQPVCTPHIKRNWILLKEDWLYTIEIKGTKNQICIPHEYFYDGASIPRLFWVLIGSPFEPRFWAAALGHDYSYLTHIVTRDVADEVFRQFLIKSEVSPAKARIMWAAVRSPAGALAWRNTKKDKADLLDLKRRIMKRTDHHRFGVHLMAA